MSSDGGGVLIFFPSALETAFRELYAWRWHEKGEAVARGVSIQPVTQDGTTVWGGLVSFSRQKRPNDLGLKQWVDESMRDAVAGGAWFIGTGKSPAALTSEWAQPLDDIEIGAFYNAYAVWAPYADESRTTIADPLPAVNLALINVVETGEGNRGDVRNVLQAAGLDFMPVAEAA